MCRHGNAFGTLLVASYGVKQMMQLRASTIWDSCLLGFEEAMIISCKLILQKGNDLYSLVILLKAK